jgi:hypothetical protein
VGGAGDSLLHPGYIFRDRHGCGRESRKYHDGALRY